MSSTWISTNNKPAKHNQITIDDCNLEYSSDDFDEPVVLGESTKSAFSIIKSSPDAAESSSPVSGTRPVSSYPGKRSSTTFTPAAVSAKFSSSPASDDKAPVTKQRTKEIYKRIITIKTTVKNIWKPYYLQPLFYMVQTTNLIVTHTFAFTKYIFLRELIANEYFALNNLVTQEFFVQIFLGLIVARTRSTR